jgi:membrane fusion protein, copper/silver efflux system
MDLVPAESLGYVTNTDAEPPLIVPTSAVLRTGKRAVVYVKKENTERPTFEGREIEIGPRAGNHFIVVSGLEEGERVVTNGAFKIDSALQIQAKPSMMNPNGGGPVPGHNHGAESSNDHSSHTLSASLEIEEGMAAEILSDYLSMHSALAGDDLETAKAAAKDMMNKTGHSGELPDLIHLMLNQDDLESFRKPHFETLSNGIIAAVKKSPKAIEGQLYIMHCPMVYGDTGADWLQADDALLNPYFGSMMLRCGDLKETVGGEEHSGHDH